MYFIILDLDTYFLHDKNDQKQISSSSNSTSDIKNIQDQNSNLKKGNILSFIDGMNSNEQVSMLACYYF